MIQHAFGSNAEAEGTARSPEHQTNEDIVDKSLEDIKDLQSEIAIALHVDVNSAEATQATDQELIKIAEMSVETPGVALKNEQAAFNDAAIESALEADSGINVQVTPIAALELDGYGGSINDVVVRLHESHATLPSGHEAAPILMAAIDELNGHPIMATEPGTVELIEQTIPERTANYQGNWTQLQTERTSSDDFKSRYQKFIEYGAEGMPEDAVSQSETGVPLAKVVATRGQYEDRIAQYDTLHNNVTSKIGYGPAGDYRHEAKSLGSVIGYDALDPEVVLFSDARQGETPLDNRGKDLIAAHEMYHGLIKPEGRNIPQILAAFNIDTYRGLKEGAALSGEKIAPQSYMKNPSELTARMAQVKNYFGMRGGEQFTPAHLEYARNHYIEDTKLDNNMDTFLQIAKDKEFVDLMNALPV